MGSQQKDNQWSTEWPTEPGWYWVAESGATVLTAAQALINRSAEPEGEVRVFIGMERLYRDDFFDAVWLRIEPPDMDAARKALEAKE